jgi:hypothetical protein
MRGAKSAQAPMVSVPRRSVSRQAMVMQTVTRSGRVRQIAVREESARDPTLLSNLSYTQQPGDLEGLVRQGSRVVRWARDWARGPGWSISGRRGCEPLGPRRGHDEDPTRPGLDPTPSACPLLRWALNG